MTQPQVAQNRLPIIDYTEDLQEFYAFRDALLGPPSPVVESSGPGISSSEPEPIPPNTFPASDIY
jgi:hypothetical protein